MKETRKYNTSDRRGSKNVNTEEKAEIRFKKLLAMIFKSCEKMGFRLEGRIVLKDKKTGKVWR
jgi:hypothetical protein